MIVDGRQDAGGLAPAETGVPIATVTTAVTEMPSAASVTGVAFCVAAAVISPTNGSSIPRPRAKARR